MGCRTLTLLAAGLLLAACAVVSAQDEEDYTLTREQAAQYKATFDANGWDFGAALKMCGNDRRMFDLYVELRGKEVEPRYIAHSYQSTRGNPVVAEEYWDYIHEARFRPAEVDQVFRAFPDDAVVRAYYFGYRAGHRDVRRFRDGKQKNLNPGAMRQRYSEGVLTGKKYSPEECLEVFAGCRYDLERITQYFDLRDRGASPAQALVPVKEELERPSALTAEGVSEVTNLEIFSFPTGDGSNLVTARFGDVLRLTCQGGELAGGGKPWLYQYTGGEPPIVFWEDGWSLRLLEGGVERVVGLDLARPQAAAWLAQASPAEVSRVTSAHVNRAAVASLRGGSLAGLATVRCDPDLTDESLSALCLARRGLVGLDVSGCEGITDLSPVRALQRLKVLRAAGCRNVADFAAVGRLASLAHLDLSGDSMADLGPINALGARLVHLGLTGSVLPAAAAEWAPSAPAFERLESLLLERCRVEGNAAPLDWRPLLSDGLRVLSLPPGVGQADLDEVCERLEHLEMLGIRGCEGVTKLSPLYRLPGLRALLVDGMTGVSEGQIETFEQQMPGCVVLRADAPQADMPALALPE